jgi:hypothetical protein
MLERKIGGKSCQKFDFESRKLFKLLTPLSLYIKSNIFFEVHFRQTCRQFHQHFTSSFRADILLTKNYKAKLLSREKLRKTLSNKKGVSKMLMKLTPESISHSVSNI